MRQAFVIIGLTSALVLASFVLARSSRALLQRTLRKFSSLHFAVESRSGLSTSNASTQQVPATIQAQSQSSITGKEITDLRRRLAEQIRTFDDIVSVLGPPDTQSPPTKFSSERLTYFNLNVEYDITFERIVENNRDGLKVSLSPKQTRSGSAGHNP
jgi:hypothetical protein